MIKKKVKRYAGEDESLVEDEVSTSASEGKKEIEQPSTGLKRETFADAYKRNRARGAKTFEFQGKKYTTESAAEKTSRTAPNESAAETARLKREGATAPRSAPKETSKVMRDIENVSAPGRKIGEATKVAAQAPKSKAAPATRTEPHFGVRGGGGGGGGSRELMLGSELDPKALMREVRAPRDLDEERMAGEGGPNFRRGGKVSSASSRGDGIAQRGKTKGRMV